MVGIALVQRDERRRSRIVAVQHAREGVEIERAPGVGIGRLVVRRKDIDALASCLSASACRSAGTRSIADFLRRCAGDADARPQRLVGRFEPRRGVDRIAMRGVVETAAAAEIADDRRPGIDADARRAEGDAARLLLAE